VVGHLPCVFRTTLPNDATSRIARFGRRGPGLGFANAFVRVNHALAHAVGARFKLSHGPRMPMLVELEALLWAAYDGRTPVG
jgi:alcohol dehydrogenase class IV